MDDTNNQTSNMDATNANPVETITETTAQTIDHSIANTEIDYKTKFTESSKEALRIREENIRLANELAEFKKNSEFSQNNGATYSNNSEEIVPGFSSMTKEEQDNLLAYTDLVTKRALDGVYKDPAIAEAKNKYNESIWLGAFENAASQYPELREHKDEFKAKYFRNDNVPSNIGEILNDVAKVYLFDKARDIGAKEAIEQTNRIDVERAGGGDKVPSPERTIEDWDKLRTSNPVKFAQEYRKSQDK